MLKKSIGVLLAIFACMFQLSAQKSTELPPENNSRIKNRWVACQPAIRVYSEGEIVTSGQPLYLTMDSLYVDYSHGLPLGEEDRPVVQVVALDDIDYLLCQGGGSKLFRESRPKHYVPKRNGLANMEEMMKLRERMVFEQDYAVYNTLEEAFPHSKTLTKAFPDKFLRISFGVGASPDRIIKSLNEDFEDSDLNNDDYFLTQILSVDLLDLSVRLFDRYLIGVQFFARPYSNYFYGYGYGPNSGYNYSFNIRFTEHRLYAEYAFFHVDRYFTRRFEVLAGVGALLGQSDWSLYYNLNHEFDYQEIIYGKEENIFGGQVRLSANYYLFPGLSVWAGAEVNIYPDLPIEAMSFPSENPGQPYLFPATSINYSSFRFKLGLSFYL